MQLLRRLAAGADSRRDPPQHASQLRRESRCQGQSSRGYPTHGVDPSCARDPAGCPQGGPLTLPPCSGGLFFPSKSLNPCNPPQTPCSSWHVGCFFRESHHSQGSSLQETHQGSIFPPALRAQEGRRELGHSLEVRQPRRDSPPQAGTSQAQEMKSQGHGCRWHPSTSAPWPTLPCKLFCQSRWEGRP